MKRSGNSFIIWLVYVDDTIVVGDDESIIDEVNERLDNEFKVKDLVNVKEFS